MGSDDDIISSDERCCNIGIFGRTERLCICIDGWKVHFTVRIGGCLYYRFAHGANRQSLNTSVLMRECLAKPSLPQRQMANLFGTSIGA